MGKAPDKIQSLINERKLVKNMLDEVEKQKASFDSRYFEIGREIKKLCDHKYADGASAWEHRYAYSFCNICLYDDL